MKIGMSPLALIFALLGSVPVLAEDTKNKNTPMTEREVKQLQAETQALINVLVQKGVISPEVAKSLTAKAEQESSQTKNSETEEGPGPREEQTATSEPNLVRVPYVSKNVRNQIREEVKNDLRKEVVESVMQKARDERWGVPGSWPSWVNKISFTGDVRFRAETAQFADDNSNQYIDVLAVNRAGGTIPAGVGAFLNTTESTDRLRLRARLGFSVKATPNWNLGFKLSTGKASNPISSNVTLSNDMSDFDLNLTRAFINYHSDTNDLKVWMGRFDNPWIGTDLVWDEDLGFGGVAARYAPIHEDGDHLGFDPFVTTGIFPLDEIALSSKDKWLAGIQTGFNYLWESDNTLKVGLGYFDYIHTQGQFNTFGSNALDYSAPKFAQKGNTLFDIRNDDNVNSQLAALASNYKEADLTMIYDMANFAPTHIIVTADYVRNVGFDAKDYLSQLEKKTGLNFKSSAVTENVDGFKFEVLVGHPTISKLDDWNFSVAYKSLKADAVLDAFTDSDFHLGGTDGKGYILTGRYGIADNVNVSMRLFSSNAISGAPLGVEIYQLDLNVKF